MKKKQKGVLFYETPCIGLFKIGQVLHRPWFLPR